MPFKSETKATCLPSGEKLGEYARPIRAIRATSTVRLLDFSLSSWDCANTELETRAQAIRPLHFQHMDPLLDAYSVLPQVRRSILYSELLTYPPSESCPRSPEW